MPGNWGHWSDVDFRTLEALLLNQHQSFTAQGRTVHLIALDDFTAGQPDAQLLSTSQFNEISIFRCAFPAIRMVGRLRWQVGHFCVACALGVHARNCGV